MKKLVLATVAAAALMLPATASAISLIAVSPTTFQRGPSICVFWPGSPTDSRPAIVSTMGCRHILARHDLI